MFRRARTDEKLLAQTAPADLSDRSDVPDRSVDDSDQHSDEVSEHDSDLESDHSADDLNNPDSSPPADSAAEEEGEEIDVFECTLCPEKKLRNQHAVDAHLTSKFHLKRVKQHTYTHRTPADIAALRDKNQRKRAVWMQRRHPERWAEQVRVRELFEACGGDEEKIAELQKQFKHEKRKQQRQAKKAKLTAGKQADAVADDDEQQVKQQPKAEVADKQMKRKQKQLADDDVGHQTPTAAGSQSALELQKPAKKVKNSTTK